MRRIEPDMMSALRIETLRMKTWRNKKDLFSCVVAGADNAQYNIYIYSITPEDSYADSLAPNRTMFSSFGLFSSDIVADEPWQAPAFRPGHGILSRR